MSSPLAGFSRAMRGPNTVARLTSSLLFGACLLATSAASAAMFTGMSSDGHAVSATADFSAAGDTLTVKLTNTTALTLDAGELFTGLDFSVIGSPTLTSDMGIQRTVARDGTFVDTGTAQNLSWSLVSMGGGMFQLNFNPDAKDGIIGPPSGGDYSGANGSINGNAGHNPFAAEMAVFELNVPGIGSAPLPSVVVKTFRFGTNLDPGTGIIKLPPGGPEVPEPSSLIVVSLLVAGIGAGGFRYRRSDAA